MEAIFGGHDLRAVSDRRFSRVQPFRSHAHRSSSQLSHIPPALLPLPLQRIHPPQQLLHFPALVRQPLFQLREAFVGPQWVVHEAVFLVLA